MPPLFGSGAFDLIAADGAAAGAEVIELVALRQDQEQALAYRHGDTAPRAEEQAGFKLFKRIAAHASLAL